MVLISYFIDTVKSDPRGYLAKNIIFLVYQFEVITQNYCLKVLLCQGRGHKV